MELVYRKFKRRRIGPCNLCGTGGTEGPLTWDHVPLQGGIELQPVEIDRAVAAFVPQFANPNLEISQNGLKFRTLCAHHNSLIGKQYDPYLNGFAHAVGRFLRTPLALPPILHVEARPTAIARAVLSHLLSARLSLNDGFFDPIIREIVLYSDMPIPPEINVFYWIYPFAQQIVLRDALMPSVRGRYYDFQRFGVLKYFPIAYLATTASQYEGLDSLTLWRNEPSSFTVNLPVNLRGARGPYWPEAPAPDNWLFGGHDLMESIRAHPARKLFEKYLRYRPNS